MPIVDAGCGNGSLVYWLHERGYAKASGVDGCPHVKTFGELSEFGYKDFFPMFKAEKFDADEWAELFKAAGAKFAGPVAEHHDGFALWDTEFDKWNSVEMGPGIDIVGTLGEALKKQDLKREMILRLV